MKKTGCILLFFLFTVKLASAQTSLSEQYGQKLGALAGISSPAENEEAPIVKNLLSFATSLIGVPYLYASGDPARGFDCSGFVSYVFHNFGFNVPRSSVEFSHTGKPTSLGEAKVGDVLLFTGTNPRIRKIGHVGIIYAIDGNEIKFIHSTSGKANGVTITDFNDYYKSRFMKVVRVL